MRRLALVLALAALAAPSASATFAQRGVYAYLANNTVVRTDATLTAWQVVRIGEPTRELTSSGTLLALSRDRRTLWALDRADNTLVHLGLGLHILRRVALPAGWSPRAVAVGPRTGKVYVAYNRDVPSTSPSRHDPLRSAHLAAFTADGTRVLHDLVLRPHGRRSWLVWTLVLDPSERRAYVSYHGSDTTGLDSVDLRTWMRCAGGTPYSGCWPRPHGAVAALPDAVVTSTGSPQVDVFARDGTLGRTLDTGLENNHLMAFALDAARDRLFAAGSCGYVPGFAVLRFSTGERLALRHGRALCGETIAAAGASVLVGKTAFPVADPTLRGSLLRVDAATGRLLRARTTPSEPVGLLVR